MLDDIQKEILYVLYEAFGGACSVRQAFLLDEITPKVIEELVIGGYLRREMICGTKLIVCRHAVYAMADNGHQNYRMTAYNIKKSCLLAEYWTVAQKYHSVHTIAAVLRYGTMHQQSMGPWDEYMAYLHSQGFYERFTIPEENTRHFVLFPKSHDPLTLSKAIKKFFDNQGMFSDIDEIQPHLSVCVPNDRVKGGILKRIDGRYWWIQDRLEIFTLECPDTKDLI